MPPDDPEDDNPLQKWLDAEERLSSEPADSGRIAEESAPGAPEVDLEEVDVTSETSRYFWAAVVLANVGLAGVSIGLMLIGFRGQWTVGGAVLLLGVLALARTYHVYRQFRTYRADDAASDSDGDGTSEGDADGPPDGAP